MNQIFIANVQNLCKRDRDLAKIIDMYGYPLQWQREPGFSSLIRIILGQQVSLTSAESTFNRLKSVEEELTPANFLLLDDNQLNQIGFSRQKIRYGRELAQAIAHQQLDLTSLELLEDQAIRTKLTSITGIGDWTVDMYLMTALQRPDVFPSKDLGVAIAIKEIKNLAARPTVLELESIAKTWRPHRAIATKILWHYYLNRKPKR